MKTTTCFWMPVLVALACSCQDEFQKGTQPTPGEEVQFSAVLEEQITRTVYGPKGSEAFPMYWENGDEVIISSPECAQNGGVGSATYKVAVEGSAQNYATSLDKTGDTGVCWGNNATGSFYSVYPASSSYTRFSSDCHTVTLTMPAQQDNDIVTENGEKVVLPDTRSCFMYARTADAKSGETVKLTYNPLSTAVRFTLNGPESGDPVTICYVRIYAPEGTNISGMYNVDLATATEDKLPSMALRNGCNYVTMNAADATTGAYLTLAQNESIEMNAFLLIAENTEITDEWYIEVGTSNGISYKKSLDTLSGDRTLVPGRMHYLSDLPALSDTEWNTSEWMANIQRNVYLSEISIPGSWYSLDENYQPDAASISAQYGRGIRAFHIDTRWRADWKSFQGYSITDLGVANGGKTYDVNGGKCMTQDAPTFEEVLKQMTAEVKDDEYMVVMCTFAQGSTLHDDWRQAVSDACKENDKVIEASTLTPNAVVADVLGHVIVIVNTNTEGEVADSKCLFFNMGLTLDQTEFTRNDYCKSPLTYNNVTSSGITMYGTHAQVTTSGDSYEDDERGYVPSLSEREEKVQHILDWSKNNYRNMDSYSHDAWLYLGLGGYIPASGLLGDDDYSSVAGELNPWLEKEITAMEASGCYYPVGIVLMNDVNAYGSLIQGILQMNNMYRKAYDPNRLPVDGAYVDGSNGVQSAAPGYSSGMIDNQTDAIGWTRCK